MSQYFAVMHTDGVLSLKDIVEDCRAKRWVPFLVLRSKADPSLPPKVVLFHTLDTARRFSRRNLPRKWLYGEFGVDDNDLRRFRDLGWEWEVFAFPFKVREDQFTIDLEVYNVSPHANVDVTLIDRNVNRVVATDNVLSDFCPGVRRNAPHPLHGTLENLRPGRIDRSG